MNKRIFQVPLLIVLLASAGAHADSLLTGPDPAGRSEYVPDSLKNVTIDEKQKAQVPLDATFEDERGNRVTLKDYFDGQKKPVLLQLGYYGCPMLCDLVSRGLVTSLKNVEMNPGTDFEVVFISFDPKESSTLAKQKKQAYMQEYGRGSTSNGFHFLVGSQQNVQKVSDAIGFNFKWVESAQQFSHPAAITVLMPDGKVSRYLYGVQFKEETLRLALVEASQNKIGTTTDHFLLTCFQYDGKQGRYAMTAMTIMRFGGVLTVLVLSVVLGVVFRKEAKKRATAMAAGPSIA